MRKMVALISGGIDSVVAMHLMLKNSVDIVAVHMHNAPFIDEKPLKKSRKLLELLAKKYRRKIKFYIIAHGANQAVIVKNCSRKYICVICRRFMYRIAEAIAKIERADAIVTGENLGQVASQTLDNLYVENKAIKMPVLRPLIGFNKNDIIKIAKDIGSYETSILPGQCCNVAPIFPETHASLAEIENNEKNLNVKELVKEAVKTASVELIG